MAYTLKTTYTMRENDWGEESISSMEHTLYDEEGKEVCTVWAMDDTESPEDANFERDLRTIPNVPKLVKACLEAGEVEFIEEEEEY